MKRFTGQPRHGETRADRRWTLEEQARILAEIRRLAGRLGSMKLVDVALDLPLGTVRRFITDGYSITPRVADALAAKLGTTADAIASGEWKAPTKAA